MSESKLRNLSMQFAVDTLKECYETEYWLELFVKSEFISRDEAKTLYNDCGTIRRMLIASLNTSKEN